MDKVFDKVARRVAEATGHAWVFVSALLLILGWLVSGPIFGFNDTWQLVINTTTTIITFLMVFLIQNTQNRDNLAINAKLDALIKQSKATNKLMNVEDQSEATIKQRKPKR
jgi:low affinity Fe/Cu permease